jgi:hypothetical protein
MSGNCKAKTLQGAVCEKPKGHGGAHIHVGPNGVTAWRNYDDPEDTGVSRG